MKSDELKEALRLLKKVLTDPRLEPGQGQQLSKARREMEQYAKSGKPEQQRLYRAVALVANILHDLVEQKATQRPE